jgi:hypothetical protein
MATWETALLNMVRHLIGDLDSANYTYSDERILGAIVVGGVYVSKDYIFDIDYTFDLVDYEISPDPVDEGDTVAMALFSLKAACLLNTNAYQAAAAAGIEVQDGDTRIKTTGSFQGFSDILKFGPCGAYTTLLETVIQTGVAGLGGAVYGPFTTGDGYYDYSSHFRSFWDDLVYRG